MFLRFPFQPETKILFPPVNGIGNSLWKSTAPAVTDTINLTADTSAFSIPLNGLIVFFIAYSNEKGRVVSSRRDLTLSSAIAKPSGPASA